MYLLPSSNAPSASIRAFHLPDGRLLWTYPLSTDVSIQAEMDGMLYLSAAANSTLIALRASDGHRLWTYRSSDGQPAANTFVAANGIVGYLFQQDTTVVAIRESSGQVLWRTQVTALKNRDYQTFPFTLTLDQGNLVFYPQGPQNSLALPVSVLRASDGHLLWSRPEANTNLILLNGTLYGLQNNGQLDAWRESDRQHLWSSSMPSGSSFVGSLTEGSPLLFLLDPVGTFYVLRATSGKLLWHYP
jgi:outer membrane protein assembly factor BamB